MKIKIGISSNINFFEKTLDRAIDSYLECGIEENDILISVGGAEIEYSKIYRNIKIDFICPNAFDWTFPINLLYKKYNSDYWFLTHDTAYAGKSFKDNIYKRIVNNDPYVSLNSSFTKSTGLVRQDYIFNDRNINFLKSIEKSVLDLKDARNIKQWIMDSNIENYLFDENKHYFSDKTFQTIDYTNSTYNHGNEKRRLDFFPELDYYKLSTNYDGQPINISL